MTHAILITALLAIVGIQGIGIPLIIETLKGLRG